MKKLTLLLFLAWGFLWETAGGQNLFTKHARVLTLPEGYVCYRTAGALDIDGRLDEASWQAAKETAPFVDISGKDFPAPLYDTRVKMGPTGGKGHPRPAHSTGHDYLPRQRL